ncbi:MAG: DUF2993 domain-containing protein [Armatimonadota bacterium]|nr:DUF2993 domain-containing protein [Armatimonadota bacterium]
MDARARLAVWLFTAFAVVLILAVALAPAVLAWRLRLAVTPSLAGPARVSVHVDAPPWSIITGRLDAVTLEARRAMAGQLPLERLTLRLEEVRVDPTRLWRGEGLPLVQVGRGEGEIILTQEDLRRFLVSARGVQQASLRLDGGAVTVEGDVRVGVVDLRMRLEGRLVPASPTTVDLYVQTLTVSGVELPREIGSVLVSRLNPLISLDGLPLPLWIASVAVEGGEVRVRVGVGERS